MERRSSVLAMVALVAFAASARAGDEWVVVTGRAFAAERVPMVKKGFPPVAVVKLIGPPLSVMKNGAVERWIYREGLALRSVTEQKDDSTMDRLRRWVRAEPSVEHSLIVDFRRGAVVNMTFTEKH